MATITPINRHTELVVESDGRTAYKVYNMMSPHYYKDKTGSLKPIDITNVQTITKGTVGEIKLREKNIASVGLRTDGNKTKYLGIRPDETQEDGSQQLEWTIEEAIINNTTQSITLNQTSSIDGITTNLGGQVVRSTRFSTRQMVPVTGSISNFQVKYKLHLTGLQISNSKYTENTTIRNNISGSGTITTGTSHYVPSDNGQFKIVDSDNNIKFRISLPVLLDSDFEQVTNDTTHTLKDNGDGTYEYIKYPSDSLLSNGISNDVTYIDATTVYGETDLDGQVTSAVSSVWNTVHDGASGGSSTGDGASSTGAAGFTRTSGGFFSDDLFTIRRSWFGFDTSAISTEPTSAEFRVATKTNTSNHIVCIEGTHTEIANSTYNDFTGYEAGWDGGSGAGDDTVRYADEVTSIASDGEYNDITLITAGINAIKNNDTTKICVMCDDDYFDQAPGSPSASNTGLYYSDNSGTSLDPYLYIVLPITPPNFKIINGKTRIIGGTIIIK